MEKTLQQELSDEREKLAELQAEVKELPAQIAAAVETFDLTRLQLLDFRRQVLPTFVAKQRARVLRLEADSLELERPALVESLAPFEAVLKEAEAAEFEVRHHSTPDYTHADRTRKVGDVSARARSELNGARSPLVALDNRVKTMRQQAADLERHAAEALMAFGLPGPDRPANENWNY